MQAWIIRQPGGPEQFSLEEIEVPRPKDGWTLIRVRAFGLNRSEWFTRRGDSPSVTFPRVLGIECVGEVVDSGGQNLAAGTPVAAMMGGMGRAFNGSYAEYTLVPNACVFPIEIDLPWEHVAALPEMLQTTHGSLHTGLDIKSASSLLIRGGTSSIGLAALALAKEAGLHVATTSRSPSKVDMLLQAGADEVWIDDGSLAKQIRERNHPAYDRVLELIGASTLLDSLHCVDAGGVVCMTGILGGKWTLEHFEPMEDIPNGVRLTSYSGGSSDITPEQLQRYISQVEQGRLTIQRGPVFAFEDLVQAHYLMDADQAGGKIVVLGKA